MCVDEWTKKGMSMSVVGVTAHFYNKKSHELNRVLLGVRRFQHPHTADRIRQLITELLNEWELPDSKIWRVITDNAKNMVKAFRTVSLEGGDYLPFENMEAEGEEAVSSILDPNLDESFDEEADDEYLSSEDDTVFEEAFGKQKHLPCFLHTLVLAFKGAVNSEDSGVFHAKKDACRLVNIFSHSSKATERLIEISGKKLLLPAKTRWNYVYHMLKRLIELRQAVSDVCDEQGIDNISNWRVLSQLVDVLAPFAKMIDYLQGEKYVTIAHVVPCINELLEHLGDMKQHQILPVLCEKVSSEIKRRFNAFLSITAANFNPTYVIATSLHPTLALALTGSELTYARQAITRFLRYECSVSSESLYGESSSSQRQEQDISCADLFPHLKQKILDAKQQGVSSVSTAEEEATAYFKQLATFPDVGNPMVFWESHRREFPLLAEYACDVLAIPASSAAVESVFSVAGHATSGRRHNLSVNLEREVMIKVNKFCL